MKYGLEEEELPEREVEEGGVITVKRRLEDARDFSSSHAKKKKKQ